MKKISILAIASSLTLSGTILYHTDFRVLAQSSPWGQVDSPRRYTNPDTGQVFCFYTSGTWAPCPGQGNVAIIPRNAKCTGGTGMSDMANQCPAAICLLDKAQSQLAQPGEYRPPAPPCNGLP